jgi:hypothetical protein
MQTAQCASMFGARSVVLNEAARDACLAQPFLVIGFAQPAPIIAMPLWEDDSRQVRKIVAETGFGGCEFIRA